MRAGAVYEDKYFLGTSMARPVIAKHQVEVALDEGAEAVSHGGPEKATIRCGLNMRTRLLRRTEDAGPLARMESKVPRSLSGLRGRARYSCGTEPRKIHSRDRNLWHISHEGGELEDAGGAPLDSTWIWTRSPQEAPDRKETVEIGFEKGTPVSVNGMRLDPVQLLELLNEIGARNAVGRVDLVENRFVGIKSRGILF